MRLNMNNLMTKVLINLKYLICNTYIPYKISSCLPKYPLVSLNLSAYHCGQ